MRLSVFSLSCAGRRPRARARAGAGPALADSVRVWTGRALFFAPLWLRFILRFAFCVLRLLLLRFFFFDLKLFEKNFCAAPCVCAKNIREISTFLVCRGPARERAGGAPKSCVFFRILKGFLLNFSEFL